MVIQASDIGSGIIIAAAVIYVGIDRTLSFGAIVAFPFILGAMLTTTTLLAWYNIDGPHVRKEKAPQRASTVQATAFLIIALLLMQPGSSAMFGLRPTPPENADSPWQHTAVQGETVMKSFEVMNIEPFKSTISEASLESKWRVYVLYSENFPADKPRGIAIFMHAHTGQDIEYFYTDLLENLARQGLIVLAPQYITEWNDEIAPAIQPDAIRGGTSDPRHAANIDFAVHHAQAAFEALMSPDSELGQSVRTDLGEGVILDSASLWIGGHSFGGGAAIHIAAGMAGDGHGQNSLVIEVLVPFGISDAEGMTPNLSHLPDHTIAHITEHDADNIVNGCDGRWLAHRLSTRDNDTNEHLPGVLHLLTQSDFHGFPRLLATHYLPVNMLHDTLADLTVHDRISAQAAFVQGTSSGADGVEEIRAHLHDQNGTLSDIGMWSDGVPLTPVQVDRDPVSTKQCIERRPPG